MSNLQKEAVHLISSLSDDNISFLIEIIKRLMPQEGQNRDLAVMEMEGLEDEKMKAFKRLDTARSEIRQYLPEDFNPERELEEARKEKYGDID